MTRARSNAISGGRAPFLGAQRSPGPARPPMIGSHRQAQQGPVTDMQQSIGNQATAQGMDVAPETPYYMETASPPPVIPSGYSGAPTPPEPTYYTDTDSPPNPQAPSVPESTYYTDTDSSPNPQAPNVPNPQAPNAPNASPFEMKSMLPSMPKFDKQDIIQPNARLNTVLPSQTFYAETDEARAPYARGFNDQGQMTNSSDGSELNTIGARQAAFKGSKPDRHIFTMDQEGKFHTADAIKENEDRGQHALDQSLPMQERFHHSSFHGGKDVAGAGELQVRDGQIELVSDTSGHYQPGSKQMMQTVQQLENNNVQTERLGVEFVGKGGTQNMQASATELLGYANHSPETAETQMRQRHGQKNAVLQELLNKSANNPDGQNLKPSELNRRPEEMAPGETSEQEQEQGLTGFYAGEEDHVYYNDEAFEDEQEEIAYENDKVQYIEDEHFETESEDEDKYYN